MLILSAYRMRLARSRRIAASAPCIRAFSTTPDDVYERKTPHEHVLLRWVWRSIFPYNFIIYILILCLLFRFHRPGMYLGQIEPSAMETWILDSDQGRMTKKVLKYSPALTKVYTIVDWVRLLKLNYSSIISPPKQKHNRSLTKFLSMLLITSNETSTCRQLMCQSRRIKMALSRSQYITMVKVSLSNYTRKRRYIFRSSYSGTYWLDQTSMTNRYCRMIIVQ